MTEEIQTVIITFTDGRVGKFSGKAVVKPGDDEHKMLITSIKFTTPIPLPEDCSFEILNHSDG